MISKKVDPRNEARKRASLVIVWAVLAAIAYLGLIKLAIDAVAKATPWTGLTVDGGLLAVANSAGKSGQGALATLGTLAIAALPVAIAGAAAFGILARVRPGLPLGGAAVTVAGAIGLAGSLALFITQVATLKNGTQFVVALATIVLVWVLLRLQRFIRRLYSRTPATASLIFVLVTLAYLILSNGANIASIVLTQVDVWLSLIAFAIILYAGIVLLRLRRRIPAR
jgi:hypothetical protein